MYYKLTGIPEQNEIVLCQVTKIYPNSVFVNILEYGKSGMIHISEVSPGRIRNLRDYVSVGKQIVCKVLRIDQQRGHIDLSLRRVNSTQRKEKLDEIKQELKAESLIKNLAKKLKKPAEKLYDEIKDKVFKEYSYIHLFFKDLVSEDADAEKIGLSKKIATELKEAVLEKFKPKKIFIQGEIRLKTYVSEGIEKIKNTLKEIQEISITISLHYLGAGRYRIIVEDFEYKDAEKTLKEVQQVLEKFKDKLSTVSFEREKD